jgi:hypothetical protein
LAVGHGSEPGVAALAWGAATAVVTAPSATAVVTTAIIII